jgi:hypothetical protein
VRLHESKQTRSQEHSIMQRYREISGLGAYEMFEARGVISEPAWPDASFQDLLRIAFRDRMIDRVDHPVIRRLRGLA